MERMFRWWQLVALCGLVLVVCAGGGRPAWGAPAQSGDNNEQETDEDVPRAHEKDPKQVSIDYFRTYGYLPESQSQSSLLEEAYELALLDFQKFMGLEPTGKLDAKTSELIGRARCGNKDDIKQYEEIQKSSESGDSDGSEKQSGAKRRRKRFALFGPKWPKSKLVYRIANYPKKTGNQQEKVHQMFENAFSIWSQETNLQFERTNELAKADLEIRFVRDYHENCSIGPMATGVLAHAHQPTPSGSRQKNFGIHFNGDVDWLTNSSLLATAIHEIGHSLGVAHSNVPESKMYPVENKRRDLHADDKKGIQTLYGRVSKVRQFYVIPKKSFEDSDLYLYSKRKDNLEECAKYTQDTNWNIAVFDDETKQCNVFKNHNEDNRAFYTNRGVGVTVQGSSSFAYDGYNTNSTSDVDIWIANNECDSIVKYSDIDDYYQCKQYDSRESSTILMKLDDSRRNEKILG